MHVAIFVLITVLLGGYASAGETAPACGPACSTADILRLGERQLRFVRRARNLCADGFGVSPACIISLTDHAIAGCGDAELQHFHAALPRRARYDEDRSSIPWRVALRVD